ncbi:hypothetical protein [Nodularia spumigena]|uniref:hypothetical protein n=1 Tax=Nodularia spumigena TaxID=70799 RepID=UPI002B2155E4|nr:hypothetical protein [Nodularia spumigena]MEA5559069.1 hypothetical protein [Nodularia spumigena CH309]
MITEKELLNFLLSSRVKNWLLPKFPEIRSYYESSIKKFAKTKIQHPANAVMGEVPSGAVSLDFEFATGIFSIVRATTGSSILAHSECPYKLIKK